jgi:hypothetical protein
MGLKKNTEGVELARNVIRDWPDTTLLGRRPHEVVAAFAVTLPQAEELLKQERRRRNL